MKRSHKNTIIVSSAGTGKTTTLVKDAIASPKIKCLMVTYTINNTDETRRKFYATHGSIPNNVKIKTWLSFLLSDLIRPYQKNALPIDRVAAIDFNDYQQINYSIKGTVPYYLRNKNVYKNKVSELSTFCVQQTNDMVIDRLEQIYDRIYIDEFQDLAGHDLDLIEILLRSKIEVILVGDPRQSTYKTNRNRYGAAFLGAKIVNKFNIWAQNGLCEIIDSIDCYRSHHRIVTFADKLYPNLARSVSLNHNLSVHSGIFLVPKNKVHQYIQTYNPQLLRYNRTTKLQGNLKHFESQALNWGESKGMTFDRVLIFSMGELKKFLQTGLTPSSEETLAKLYVALTRARYSVGIVHDGDCHFNLESF